MLCSVAQNLSQHLILQTTTMYLVTKMTWSCFLQIMKLRVHPETEEAVDGVCSRVCHGTKQLDGIKGPTDTQRSESRWKYLCGAEALKIQGSPVISGVCAEQLLRFSAISVSNYSAVCVRKHRLIGGVLIFNNHFWLQVDSVQEVHLLLVHRFESSEAKSRTWSRFCCS